MTIRHAILSLMSLALAAGCGTSTPVGGNSDATDGPTPISDTIDMSTGLDLPDPPDLDECDGDECACETLGCTCERDGDCISGYCIRVGDGSERVCSEICVDDCSLEEYDCVTLQSSGSDAVRICVPTPPNYCAPCERDADCGSTENLCREQLDGLFCATECSNDRPCPPGAECSILETGGTEFNVCVPTAGVCSPCVDEDGDGHGLGDECAGNDCDDTEISVFEGGVELCDGLDNDCDLSVDEEFNVLTDLNHCGECGNVCDLDNATEVCADGSCAIAECDEDYGDCDGEAWNGCETWLDSPESCGACEAAGAVPGSGCGTCETGVWTCQSDGSATCEFDAGTDALNDCGGCDAIDLTVGETCGTCETGVVTCVSDNLAVCAGDAGDGAINDCGGCAELDGDPAGPCGTCGSGIFVCDVGTDSASCLGDRGDDARNECGGCTFLDGSSGDRCGTCETGTFVCAAPDILACLGDLGPGFLNGCGGCADLAAEPDDPCGTCGLDAWACDEGDESVSCSGDTRVNECDGCSAAPGAVDGMCGTCDTGLFACDGVDVVCDGDEGDDALDACGDCLTEDSCTPGDVELGDSCGVCAFQIRTCLDTCGWGGWECVAGGVCTPGESSTDAATCGECGEGAQERTRTCSDECLWGDYGDWGGCETTASCSPADIGYDTRECGDCGEGTQTRARTCRSETCSWDAWGDWGACDTAATCSSGETEEQTRACGNCSYGSQSRSRSCDTDSCRWGSWSLYDSCVGGGTCAAGSSHISACGSCGTQTDTCTGSCNWSIGACLGEGECSPGTVSAIGCGTCQSRTCSSSCDYPSTCTSCTCSAHTLCGWSCTDGYHMTGQSSVLGCTPSGFSTRSTCTPNCGSTIYVCGYSCPTGYYHSAASNVLGCSTSGFSQRTTCSMITGSTLYVCGYTCPSGYVATGSSDVLGCSTSGFSRRTTCSAI